MGAPLRRLVVLAAAVVALPAAAGPARAQGATPATPHVRDAEVPPVPSGAVRLDVGRFTAVAYPPDVPLVRTLLRDAARRDSFPGLPRPSARVLVAVAPDARRFQAWTGPSAPHWGVAIAIPALQRVVLRGGNLAAAAGDPTIILRHELAHLALHEAMGDLPPRWFDEGYASYAAGEWGREELLSANLALLYRRMPGLDSLDRRFVRGEGEAAGAYALAHRAVAELAALDPERGLALFFRYWREEGRLDPAVRRAYGITLDGFEERWRQRTRQRYGVLAVLGEMSVGAGFALLVVLPLSVVRGRRDRERWAALRAADARAVAAAVAAGESDGPPPQDEPGVGTGGVAVAPPPGGAADAGAEPAAVPAKGSQPFA